jgi:hypothetical protein
LKPAWLRIVAVARTTHFQQSHDNVFCIWQMNVILINIINLQCQRVMLKAILRYSSKKNINQELVNNDKRNQQIKVELFGMENEYEGREFKSQPNFFSRFNKLNVVKSSACTNLTWLWLNLY